MRIKFFGIFLWLCSMQVLQASEFGPFKKPTPRSPKKNEQVQTDRTSTYYQGIKKTVFVWMTFALYWQAFLELYDPNHGQLLPKFKGNATREKK